VLNLAVSFTCQSLTVALGWTLHWYEEPWNSELVSDWTTEVRLSTWSDPEPWGHA
jgi:ABC-type spermidine/putrescine transport system permease subunit II